MRSLLRSFLPLALVSLTYGCDLYLPQCGSASILERLRDQTLGASGLQHLEAVGMVRETAHSLKDRTRSCQATLQPTAEFLARLNAAKSQSSHSGQRGLLGMIGEVVVSQALPDRLETVTVFYQIQANAGTHEFDVEVEQESLDQLSHLDMAYKLTDLAIRHILPSGDASTTAPSGDAGRPLPEDD